ncbi:fumarylacetoacetate hydrolase family protein [Bacillus horti]|uniref:2-keto-4-pentenoate hydratase/2-oxohepta-3-ene-1,7-dioic acid hydratase in catechol pathway n=1 Tax=Caldalkalibacillus horti TaxID=77523 RepID=A0ABT9VWY8_9BACI|nr:fumarylacetoacetate hydrolase family protein [Bacillus horti]MDQ0165410.1 2-keto-4-pentenoate hydratase/2-oxohepta-3-ene-1,7-dioic acid hydratase in catechol pathway [Bacillus horti]
MNFVTFKATAQSDNVRWGVEKGEEILEIFDPISEYPDLLSFIRAGKPALELLNEKVKNGSITTRYEKSEVKVLAPYAPPKNIFCIGKNYADHVLEMAKDQAVALPKFPVIFTKPYTAIIGQGEEIQSYPELTQQLDYEGELVVIIGKEGKNISAAEAFDYVFGYSILNDVTARDLQQQHVQFFKGKSLDSFAPFGPRIVHRSAIENPHQLQIKTLVNGEVRQNGTTSDMIFSIPALIEVISRGMTLEPGDLIATGTPSGVGNGFNPPKFIKAGDTVSIEVSDIGTLENPVV